MSKSKIKKAAYNYLASIFEKVFVGLLMATIGFYFVNKKSVMDFMFIYLNLVNLTCFLAGLFFSIKGAKHE